MTNSTKLPSAKEMITPLIQVLSSSNRDLSVKEIEESVSKLLKLSSEQLSIPHDKSRTEFQYRLAWTRSYAKKQGLVISPRKKIWGLSISSNQAQA